MATCPRWAQNHAERVFDLVALNKDQIVRQVLGNCKGPLSSRTFKRASQSIKGSRIIERRHDLLVGWHRATIFEDERSGMDATIALVGVSPLISQAGIVFQYVHLGLTVHKHALSRLFERALQPPEGVASSLLSTAFVNSIPPPSPNPVKLGFAFPFQGGRFVGSLEFVRDTEGALTSTFGIRSWLPGPIPTFTWTDKASRTLEKAIKLDRKRRILAALRQATGPPCASKMG